MSSDCPICADKFNGSTRKKCQCPYCQVDYCRECVGAWMTSLVDEPRCPNDTCKKPWSREYVDSVMTKVWRESIYRVYRETLLFDREKALLPSTQPRIEAINEAKRIVRDILDPMRERRKTITQQIAALHVEEQVLNQQVWDLQNHTDRLREGVGVDEETVKKRSTFVRRCPANGCRGFLSSAWKCGVCDMYSCSDCHEVKGVARDSDHTCDPNNVETAKLLAKDTKACPKCGEMITKIDGCDQMWCVSCHSAFSWRTGQIASGIVHNPHYYEWQRKINNGDAPRNPGDVPCGGLIEWHVIRRAICDANNYPGWLSLLESAHRRIGHVQNIDILGLNRDNNVNDNIDLRIQYLLKEIDDDAMKAILQQREKRNEKDRELRRIYETLVGAGIDIFRRIIQVADEQGKVAENFQPFVNEFNELRLFINSAIDVLRRRYSSSIRGFSDNWDRVALKKSRINESDTEIKTIFGNFNDLCDEILNDLNNQTTPSDNEDSLLKYKPISQKIRKASRIREDLPRTSDTRRIIGFVIDHLDYRYKYLVYSGGIRKAVGNMNYYKQRADGCSKSIEDWKKHAETLELTVKPMNTIE